MQVNILEYLENGAVRNCAGKIAIVDGARDYTFAQLEDYAKRCATLLVARTDVINQPIAVYLPKNAATIFADLGIVYSGNIYANLDVRSPALRTRAILDCVDPVLVITNHALASQLEAIGVAKERLFFIEDIYEDRIATDSGRLWQRLERLIDTDPLCIIHTSGSTGIPKGVVLSHRGVIDFMDWCFDRLKLSARERIGSLSPFYFDIYILELHLCLAKGATMVIIPDQMPVFPANLMRFLAEQAISFIFWVPSIMVNISSRGLLEQIPLPELETVFFAGEVFPMKHLNRWRRTLPRASFVNLYGPIEITVDCTYFHVDREFADDEMLPIGFPCRNTDILILNEQGHLCQAEEHGELCVRGTSLAMGYWNNSEKTTAAFVQNPLNKRYPELIYRTGDVVFRNDRGEIMLVGRKDFQIKHMGYRIELPEIEFQVLRIQGIANACVLYNEGEKAITLFYESSQDDLTPAIIRRDLSGILPKYMLPTVFHRVLELPCNSNGKIDRHELNRRLVEPSPSDPHDLATQSS